MSTFIHSLQTLPPIYLSMMSFLLAYGSVLLFASVLGKHGLYVIIVLLIISANVQVLKVTEFSFFNYPVALGTELFAATYLATDILSEMFGPKAARTGVILGFMAMVFWSLFAIITLGFAPVSIESVGGDAFLAGIHDNLSNILTPAPTILIASLSAYLVSQLLDVYIFTYLRKKTQRKHLWLRNNVSTLVSALIDNTIFSLLAWIVLSANPLPFGEVLKTYILGTYIFRIVAALLDTPMIYLAKKTMYVEK